MMIVRINLWAPPELPATIGGGRPSVNRLRKDKPIAARAATLVGWDPAESADQVGRR
jgi:hypothetical protein